MLCGPVFHCYSCPLALFACPIGILANFSALHLIPFLAIGTLVGVGAVFGSFVCGWACPFGYLQDLAARLPTPKFKLPALPGLVPLRRAVGVGAGRAVFLRRVPPAVLLPPVPGRGLGGAVPFVASQAIAGGEIVWPSATKITILAVFLIAMLFTFRPWCTVFCPLGAIFTACNRVSLPLRPVSTRSGAATATCAATCADGRSASQQRAGDLRCIRCLDCNQCRALSVGTIFERAETLPERRPSCRWSRSRGANRGDDVQKSPRLVDKRLPKLYADDRSRKNRTMWEATHETRDSNSRWA